jgi:hypothetical protein
MICSPEDAFSQFCKWEDEGLTIFVVLTIPHTVSIPLVGVRVDGRVADLEGTEAVEVEWAGGRLLLNLRGAAFRYAEPREAVDSVVRAQAVDRLEACVQADWPAWAGRCVFCARRNDIAAV